ncbi:MAG: endonuclease domain-containing protein [Thermoanaerobaculia bacterium]
MAIQRGIFRGLPGGLTPEPPSPCDGEGGRESLTLDRGDLAREMRRRPTVTEDLLWQQLRDSRLSCLKFRRQHRVGRFIADFYCASRCLVVEVDGGVHERRKEQDRARDEYLAERGLRVVRVSAERVLSDMRSVLHEIWKAAESQLPLSTSVERGARG